MSSHPSCPVCDREDSVEVGTAGVCHLWRCSCGLVFADRAVWRDPYATSDYYDPAHQPAESYPLQVSATDRDRIATVRRLITGGRFLDYGGGVGRTALAAHQAGFETLLLEDSHKAVFNGRQYHPEIEWIQARDIPPSVPDASLSVVTLFHVLEHLLEPRVALAQIWQKLQPGGVLVIEVPNWGSHMRRIRGLRWQYVLDHHVNHFDAASLHHLVRSLGFQRQRVEYRRTFAINETQPWKEPLKKMLCLLGFGEILRCSFVKPA